MCVCVGMCLKVLVVVAGDPIVAVVIVLFAVVVVLALGYLLL